MPSVRSNNSNKSSRLANSLKSIKASGNTTNLLLLLGGVVLIVGVIFMLVQMRTSHEKPMSSQMPMSTGKENFESPLEWDQDKEVMVVFHKMERCPHCVDFQSVWDEVFKIAPGEVRSKKGKTCKMVTVGPNHSIEKTSEPVNGFPTVRIYKTPADFVEFNGHRTKEEVVDFILKNA
jgi:hypothetical protein